MNLEEGNNSGSCHLRACRTEQVVIELLFCVFSSKSNEEREKDENFAKPV